GAGGSSARRACWARTREHASNDSRGDVAGASWSRLGVGSWMAGLPSSGWIGPDGPADSRAGSWASATAVQASEHYERNQPRHVLQIEDGIEVRERREDQQHPQIASDLAPRCRPEPDTHDDEHRP